MALDIVFIPFGKLILWDIILAYLPHLDLELFPEKSKYVKCVIHNKFEEGSGVALTLASSDILFLSQFKHTTIISHQSTASII